MKPQKWIRERGGWQRLIKVEGVLCADGVQRVFRPSGEPDTFWTQPGYVQVRGKTVTGHVYMRDTDQVWVFAAYTYRKNHTVLLVR